MGLIDQVNEDLKDAMRKKEAARLRGLRAIKSAIMLKQTQEGGKRELSEEDEIQLLQKLVKQRKESHAIYMEKDRHDLAAKEEEEIVVIEAYLPEQMDEAELRSGIGKIVQDLNAGSMKDMGKVMGVATKEFAGKADGKLIAEIVKDILK